MAEKTITVIPARKRVGSRKQVTEEKPKLRVAAYCRVSTDRDEQESSYEAQVEHYTEFIDRNPEWQLAGIYADDGISGTNTKKREEFNRMIEDCMASKIDMVITKSISRFARNTLDCLKYIRQLKEKNISVYFEKENINTMDAKGEVLLTIMASLAQQESQSLSQNVKLGLQFRYQAGKVQVNHNRFLGYTKDDEGNLVIVPEEAEIVLRIYREYLEGASLFQIGQGLEADGIKTAAGSDYWLQSTLKKILTNEKYIGDALLQKTYTVDFLNKKRVANNGIVPQYYVENSHPAIIPREKFMKVREEMRRAICALPTNTAGPVCISMLKSLNATNQLKSFKANLFSLTWAQRMPSDTEIKDTLKTLKIYSLSSSRTKTILDKLENNRRKEYVPTSEYTIEHIMPQTLSDDWKSDLGADANRIHETYVHTIGNLTLTGYNSEYQNKRFSDKVDCTDKAGNAIGYRHTPIKISSYLTTVSKWGEDEILARAEMLSDELITIWKYPKKD